MRRAAALAAGLAAVLASAAAAAPAGPELEPYRALASSAAGVRLVAMARAALADPPAPAEADTASLDWPAPPRPLYVTLVRAGATRACLGTDAPLGSLAHTVRALAARLRTDDRRRAPVGSEELEQLRVVIAFAGASEPIADPDRVDPMREGLRIETDRGAIAFLPGEARTVAWALREARRAAVLAGAASDARYSRFDVVTLSGPARLGAHD